MALLSSVAGAGGVPVEWAQAWRAAEPVWAHALRRPAPDTQPLRGVRILDLSRLLPGPMATRHLADLGAQVLKVEPPHAPGGPGDDAARMGALGAPSAGVPVSHFYRVVNHGKRRVTLDLKQPDGLATLRAWVVHAHAVVEGFRPGVMARLGLDYAALAQLNPRIVLTSVSGYGQQGPQRAAAGHDINYLAQAGVTDQTRGRDGRPVISHLQMADQLGGAQTAAIGTLAGIVGGLLHGQGGWVDVSMTDAVRQHLVISGTEALAAGTNPAPGTSLLDGGVPCYNLYRTQDDRWMAVGALELKFWHAVCDALDQPGWRDRHWTCGDAPGSEGARALISELAAVMSRHTQAHWTAWFADRDACVTPVVDAYTALFGAPSGVSLAAGLPRLTDPAVHFIPSTRDDTA